MIEFSNMPGLPYFIPKHANIFPLLLTIQYVLFPPKK